VGGGGGGGGGVCVCVCISGGESVCARGCVWGCCWWAHMRVFFLCVAFSEVSMTH